MANRTLKDKWLGIGLIALLAAVITILHFKTSVEPFGPSIAVPSMDLFQTLVRG